MTAPGMAAYLATMSAKHHDPLVTQRAIISPNRPYHQLSRSVTEQSPPFKQSRVHQYLHRKDRERNAAQAARGSLELSRATPLTTGGIPEPAMVFWTGDVGPNAEEAGTSPQISHEQKERDEAIAAALRKSLVELNAFSNATISRLNESYSSVVERLGSLQNTIEAMKELAAMSQGINDRFASESRTLVDEIESQLSVYDQSTDQKKRVQELQARIHAGRDKVNSLSMRVDAVSARIEGWERADKEWQEKTRRRLKAIWIVISVAVLVLMFLLFGAQYGPSSTAVGKPTSEMHKGTPPMASFVGNKSRNAAAMAEEIREELTRRRDHGSTGQGQAALRALDEL
ncbi:hypothetical protein F4808DRAFT_336986 [Astrocystis sublimbata]|nr:hypothetical protein F4808DRAFT_336986 [Astrocystis sublimbata]